MSLPADGVNANALTETTTIPTGKKLIFLDPDTNEGGIITLENLTKQILSNLATQTFNLDQGTKTLLAALNELNSKATSKTTITENLEKEFANFPNDSVSFLQCQNAIDSPRKGMLALCINYKISPTWGFQYIFSYGYIYFRNIGNGIFNDWQQIK